ncbi:hypothetical protein QBC32DRAFT_43297 [Pseudoneurospora amorphoporcata]|uniref:Uncharacterized protein n=1 Tax=Pseudoneurospora amorphoporcata TaxID=241081 RepID=A0AAN6P0G2_9PEZI|nr:hypothetical protein QBC32DRAFT_43297 [Pseudoneurospora amorphoporcata]
MCGPQHETRHRDASITQLSPNGHFTLLEEHSRSSSVYNEIVESYSEARRKSHQMSFSPTVRNIASQPALRREEWSTPYMQMLLALDKIPRLHNILVSYFTWLLLVAFIIVTGSFTSSESGSVIMHIHITMQPLFIANPSCMALGILACLWLGIRWRRNYVWLINRLYMHLFLNGLAGVLASMASVYAQGCLGCITLGC